MERMAHGPAAAQEFLSEYERLVQQYRERYDEPYQTYVAARETLLEAIRTGHEESRLGRQCEAEVDSAVKNLYLTVVADHEGLRGSDIHTFMTSVFEVPRAELAKCGNIAEKYDKLITRTADNRIYLTDRAKEESLSV